MVSEAGTPAKEPVLRHILSLEDRTGPVEGRLDFGEIDRARLAAFLNIQSLDQLSFTYLITPLSEDRFRLTGELSADLIQHCVVTLDPVAERLRETVCLECWPQEQIEALAREVKAIGPEALPEDPPVPILHGRIDLGALVGEIFASAINPYPRKDGVEFDWHDPKVAEAGGSAKPFAGLAKLKPKD
jgi:uncharacterized metal-binding protein YceD (DUF177 family)